MGKKTIGPFEYEVLVTLMENPPEPYGIAIRNRIVARFDHEVSLGGIYLALGRLETKKFVSSQWGPSKQERGGRRKRLYQIEEPGRIAAQRFDAKFPEVV